MNTKSWAVYRKTDTELGVCEVGTTLHQGNGSSALEFHRAPGQIVADGFASEDAAREYVTMHMVMSR
jgi:hypothetical protein